MALTFPISIPDYEDIQEMRIRNLNAVARTVSPYTFSTQVQENAGDAYVFLVRLAPMRKSRANAWIAFLKALRGGANTFLLGDAHRRTPEGTAATYPGAPRVNGSSQTGGTLIIDGAQASQTGWLLAGDWFQLGTGSDARLYQIVQDVDTDSGGNATLVFSPELRSSPADNAVVYTDDTEGCFRLTDNTQEWSVDKDHWHEIEFEAIESL